MVYLMIWIGLAHPVVELRVTTYSGNVYIAGVGDDCASAIQGSVIPSDWIELKCVPGWTFR
jgi:hypothetical protein